MLQTRSIPIYADDDPDDWHTFLYKAAKGSIKAPDTLTYSNMAYMVAVTGDLTCPDTMDLDHYNTIIRERFPIACPFESIQHFHDAAINCNWIASPFRASPTPRLDPAEYVAIWGRSPVSERDLMNDAMLLCLARWSADHYIECVDHYDTEYDSRIVTAAMLYVSVTWPGTEIG